MTRICFCIKVTALLLPSLSGIASAQSALREATHPPLPSFYARQEYGTNPGCVGQVDLVVADVNNDGILDIYCSSGQFLYGAGRGNFIVGPLDSSLSSPDAQLVDINGDGNLDLVALNTDTLWGFRTQLGDGKGGFGPAVFYPIADNSNYFIAEGDFNGDGIGDFVTVGEEGVWLLTGLGNGLFNNPILAIPGTFNLTSRFRAADMNRDGNLDLVVSIRTGFEILFGNGNGSFQPPVTYTSYKLPNITIADINGDGYPDVLCASVLNENDVTIFPGQASGTLGAPYNVPLPNYEDVEVGDVNGDGIPDLVSDVVDVAYGLGRGKFSNPLSFAVAGGGVGNASQVVLAQLRQSGGLDLVTNAVFSPVSVLLNTGKGTFEEGITTTLPSGLTCGVQSDFNNDGITDLGFIENGTSFLVEYGTGRVAAPFSTGPSTAIPQHSGLTVGCPSNFGDINGDGIPDMLIPETTKSGSTTVLYPFFGVGNGTFKSGAAVQISGDQSTVYLVDVNGDGKADLITTATNQIWYGNGNGTFNAPVTLLNGVTDTISDVVWADLNGDGKLDLVVQVEDGMGTYFLLSQPSGGFTQTSMTDCATACFDTFGVALGDLNGDGIPDLVLGSALNNLGVYINNGLGEFTFSTELTLGGLAEAMYPILVDLNGDGMLDVTVSDGSNVGVCTNYGGMTFSQAQYFGQEGSGPYFGNWHGQAASAGLADMMMPGSGNITMLLNETK